MNCPRCLKPMVLLRESYVQVHDDPECPRVDGHSNTMHEPIPEGCEITLAEWHCQHCQIGVHPPVGIS